MGLTVGPSCGATVLITGITELVTNDPAAGDGSSLGIVRNAALIVDGDGLLAWVGPASEAPAADSCVDVVDRAVIPGFVDSHTHSIFAGDRADEFAARMTGTPYDGGGISTTVAATSEASETTLRALLVHRITEMQAQGTTSVEIKSGYGLSVVGEERALRLAAEFTTESTFLGAHVVPPGAERDDYIRLVTGPMLAACAPFARWIDVFCEPASPHAFDGDEAREVLTAGAAAGLGLRVHGNQLAPGPGVRLSQCPSINRRRSHRGPCQRLQPGNVRFFFYVPNDRSGCARDGDDSWRSPLGSHRRRGGCASPS